jgi:hypothetical protein
MKEPKAFLESLEISPLTFGGTDDPERLKHDMMLMINKAGVNDFNKWKNEPMLRTVKKESAMTGLQLKEDGKVMVQFGNKLRTNQMTSSIRSHEAIVGPDLEMMAELAKATKELVEEMRPILAQVVEEVNKEFDLDAVFKKFGGHKAANHRQNTLNQLADPT